MRLASLSDIQSPSTHDGPLAVSEHELGFRSPRIELASGVADSKSQGEGPYGCHMAVLL